MNTRSTLARLGALSAVSLGVVALAASPASAHVTVTPDTTAAGQYAVLTFSVGHGCEGSPTTAITISIPEGINAVTPTRNPSYTVEKEIEQLNPPVVDAHGNELAERVSTVVYTAKTPLPDGYRDAFELQVQIPEDAAGETLAFPTIQTCQQGETAWTEIPAEGQTEDDLESPAPAFEVTEATGEGHHGEEMASSEEASAESTSEGAEEASAADSGDDGGNGLALAGLIVGAVGVLVGGAAFARSGRASS